jgi:asparagine synthase (glutamine-hydrolysing)
MPIAGIAITNDAMPLSPVLTASMLSALKIGESGVAKNGTFRSARDAQIGAMSQSASASVWYSENVIVACDCDRNDIAGWPNGAGRCEDPAHAIGKLYAQSGTDCFKQLRGAFSLAIWDKHERTMLVAVDRFAAKPLTYSASASQIIFASQPRALFASKRIEKQINAPALASYLNFGVVPAPECAFRSLSKLPGGCFLSWKDGTTRLQRYWDLEYSESVRASEDHLARELFQAMSEAVQLCADDTDTHRLGCFLSGGTDSSSILGLLSRQRQEAIQAFSIGFSEERFNELEYARIAAAEFKTRHSITILRPEEAIADLHKLVAAYDEPFGNSSVLPTYACLKAAQAHGINLMLAGDGGDELFGGNQRYQPDRIYNFYHAIPRLIRHSLIEPAATLVPAWGALSKVRGYVGRLAKENPEHYFQWLMLQQFPPGEILGPDIQLTNGHRDLLSIPRSHYQNAPARSELNRLLYIDIKMTLGDNDLPKVARAAELVGVNVRFPFLDPPLADFSGKLPVHLKVRGMEKRYLFKKATSGLLPPAILKKKKHGFGLPIGIWLKEHPLWRNLAQDVLLDPASYQRGFYQRSFVEKLFRLMDSDSSTYYGDLLWIFLMAELWYRQQAGKAAS